MSSHLYEASRRRFADPLGNYGGNTAIGAAAGLAGIAAQTGEAASGLLSALREMGNIGSAVRYARRNLLDTNVPEALKNLAQTIQNIGTDSTRIERASLISLQKEIAQLFELPAGEGHPLKTPLSEETKAKLGTLQAALERAIRAHAAPQIDFSEHADILQEGLQVIIQVLEENSPEIVKLLNYFRTILTDTLRKANSECEIAHGLLEDALRSDGREVKRDELLAKLSYIIDHPIFFESAEIPLTNSTRLRNALRDRPGSFDKALAQTVYNELNTVMRKQRGEVEQIIAHMRGAIFDPNAGLLRQSMDTLLGKGGIADQFVSDAPQSMVILNDSLLELLRGPTSHTTLSHGYFNTLRFFYAAHLPKYLGKELLDEEQAHCRNAIRTLGKYAFSTQPTKEVFTQLRAALHAVKNYIEAGSLFQFDESEKAAFLERLQTFEGRPLFYEEEGHHDEQVESIPPNYQRDLRALAQFLTKAQILNPNLDEITTALRALEKITISEERVPFSPAEKTSIKNISTYIYDAMIARTGRVYTMFHDLKRALLHPEQGLLPKIVDEYFREIGRDALQAIHLLESLDKRMPTLQIFMKALEQTRLLQRRFETLMHRKPSESENTSLQTILRTLTEVTESPHNIFMNFSSTSQYEEFLDARAHLVSTIRAEQGKIQGQITGILQQVEGVIETTFERVQQFTSATSPDAPLLKLQSALTIFTATIQGNTTSKFQEDKQAVLDSITPILSADGPGLQAIFGRPENRIIREIREELSLLKDEVTAHQNIPTREAYTTLLEKLGKNAIAIQKAIDVLPDRGTMQRDIDRIGDSLMRRVDTAAAVMQRRFGGMFGSSSPATETTQTNPPPASVRESVITHPALECMENILAAFRKAGITPEERSGQIYAALNGFDSNIARSTIQSIGVKQGKDEAWAKAHLHEDQEVVLWAFAHVLKSNIETRREERKNRFYLSLYENTSSEKPFYTTNSDKIEWAKTAPVSPKEIIHAVAKSHTPSSTRQREETTVPQAAPQRTEGESSPSTTETAGIGAVCSGLFSGALHFIQNAPHIIKQFGLGALAEFIQYHLDRTVIPIVQNAETLDVHQKDEIKQAIQENAERLKEAAIDPSKYQAALLQVARDLSRYDIFVNGTSFIPAIGDPYQIDNLREADMRRIARAERRNTDSTREQDTTDRIKESKKEFKDAVGMYITYMIAIGDQAGKGNRTHEIHEAIHREIAADAVFYRNNPRGSTGYLERFEELEVQHIPDFSRVDEDDPTMNIIMNKVAEKPVEQRKKYFKELLCKEVDERTDISKFSKIWLKWITIPLSMTFIPFFIEKTIDKFVWKIRMLIHKATKREEGTPVTVINTKVVNEITGFFAKYRKAIQAWSRQPIGESRNDAIERFMFQRNQNKGWEQEEVYSQLGGHLVDEFFADTSIEEPPQRWANTTWEFITTRSFSPTLLGTIGDVALTPFKIIFGGTAYLACKGMYWIAYMLQGSWNIGSRYVMQKVAMNTTIIEQLTNTASSSLYGPAYRNTLNKLFVRQLREASKLLRIHEKDTATEKNLQIVLHIIDDPTAKRKKAFDHLDNAWAHLRTKLSDGDIRVDECKSKWSELQRYMGDDGLPTGIAIDAYNQLLKNFATVLWKIHTEFKSEDLTDAHPNAVKEKVSELIKQALPVLDERAYLDPERAREDDFFKTSYKKARGMFLDQAVDSIAGLALTGCATLLEKDFLESQLATALEASNDVMYCRQSPDDDERLASNETESLVNSYMNNIIQSVVNTTIDGAVDLLCDKKTEYAINTINWMKIALTEGVGLRCKTPILKENITHIWEEILSEYEQAEPELRDSAKLDKIYKYLGLMLTELNNKRDELKYKSISDQMKNHLGKARDSVDRSLHKLQDTLEKLIDKAENATHSRDVATHTNEIARTLERAHEQISTLTNENLRAVTAEDLGDLQAHAGAVRAILGHIQDPDTQLQRLLNRANIQTAELETFATRITLHQQQTQTLDGLRVLIDQYADAKRRGLVETARASGAAAVVVQVSGGNAEANRIQQEIEEILSQLGEHVPFDREYFRPILRQLLAASTAEAITVSQGEFIGKIDRTIAAEKTQVLQDRDRLAANLTDAIRYLDEYNNHRDRVDDDTSIDELIAEMKERIKNVRTTTDKITYPPYIKINILDLSQGSLTSEWIKQFIYTELEQRARQAVGFVKDEVVFKSAIHHAAGALLRHFANPREVQRRNQTVIGG